MMMLALWFITLGLCDALRPHYVYQVNMPVEEPKNWRRATPDDFSCSQSPEWDPEAPYTTWNVETLGFADTVEVEGFFCYKNNWATSCSTNFLMSKQVKHTITHTPIALEECQAEMRKRDEGNSQVETYPNPSCAWLSEIEKTSTFVHLTPQKVALDLHTNHLVSPSFVGGICYTSKYCVTIHRDRIWIPRKPIEAESLPHVFERTRVKVTVDLTTPNNLLNMHSLIHGPKFAPVKLEGACSKQILNKPGILLANGIWIGTPPSNSKVYFRDKVTKHQLNNPQFLTDIKHTPCPPEAIIRIPTSDYNFHYIQLTVIHLMAYHFCMDSLEKIRSNLPITRLDLARFAPRNPGLGNVFLLTPDGIKVGTARYEISEITSHAITDDIIGYSAGPKVDQWANPIYWRTWPLTADGYLNGPNGVYLRDKQVIHPETFYHEEIDELDILIHHETKLLPHVMIETLSNYTGDVSVETVDKRTTLHLNSGIFPAWEGLHWFGSLGDRLIILFVLTTSTIITLWAGCLFCPCKRRRRSKF
nr:MAG: glycoprotein [Bat tupavirus CX1]